MGGKGKQIKTGKAHQKPSKSSNFQKGENFGDNKLMTFDLSNSFGGIRVDDDVKTSYGIDSNLEITFRKMTKKDATTKLKALKDFIAQLPQLDINEKAIEIFGKLYVQLSMDVDNLVRENTQNALMAMIQAQKVNYDSPVVMKIFPYLLISMYDVHPVTATVAQNCFQKIFSSQNVGEILAMCHDDVLENFIKNITVLNAQTICSTHSYTPEECQAKYERVVIGSLKGYGLYIEKMSKEKLEELKEKNISLIEDEKFLNLYKSKSPGVRSAYYETICSLLQHASSLLKNVETKLAALVFKSIDENDPSISSHVWSCVLLTQIKVDNWWSYINIKLFFEKLFTILRSCNNASLIFPNLLPLVSNFKDVFQGNQLEAFHANLMKNLHHGLTNELQSDRLKSEFSAIISAYFEVLQFIIMQIVSDANMSDEEKLKLSNRYIDDYTIATIFWCLNHKKASFPRKLVYQQTAKLVNYFFNNSSNALYDELYKKFWNEIYQILANGMETNQDLESTSSSQVEFVKNILPPTKKHVRMESVDETKEGDLKTNGNQSLNELVQKLCRIYIDKINVTLDVSLVKSLELFLKDFQSSEMYNFLQKDFNVASTYELFEIFEKWLEDEDLQCESVIEIVTILFSYVEKENKAKLLTRWTNMKDKHKNWFLLRTLDVQMSEDGDVKQFLKSDNVSKYLIECSKRISDGEMKENLKILCKCFQQKSSGYSIANESIYEIIKILCATLLDATKEKSFKPCAQLLADIFKVISLEDLKEKIFLCFFECSLSERIDDEEILWKMISSWQNAIYDGKLKINAEILNSVVRILSENLGNLENLHKSRLEFLALIVSRLFMTILKEGCEHTLSELIDKLVTSDYDLLSQLSSHMEILNGKIIPKITGTKIESDNFEAVLNESIIKRNIFAANVILMMSVEELRVLKSQNDEEELNVEVDDDEDLDDAVKGDMFDSLFKQLIENGFLAHSSTKIWSSICLEKIIKITQCQKLLKDSIKYHMKLNQMQKEWILYTDERLKILFENMSDEVVEGIRKRSPDSLSFLLCSAQYSQEDGVKKLLEISSSEQLTKDQLVLYESFNEIEKKIIPLALLDKINSDLFLNVALLRLLIRNHLSGDFSTNEATDLRIVTFSLNLLDEIILKQKTSAFLLYKKDISEDSMEDVLLIVSIMNFLSEIITTFPSKLNELQWDFVRLALSNWTLTLKKSLSKLNELKIQAFVVSIYRLNATLLKFIETEKTKSSSQLITSVIDEWQAIFSTDVNTILLQVFISIVNGCDNSSKYYELFIDTLCHCIAVDFTGVLRLRSSTISLKDCLEFSIRNMKNSNNRICIVASNFVMKLSAEIIRTDQELLVQNNSKYGDEDVVPSDWHKLDLFKKTLEECHIDIDKNVDISSLRFSEIDDATKIPPEIALTYLLSWNCILSICADSPLELRSVYINWISTQRYHDKFFAALFDIMPRSVVKAPDMCTQLGFSSFSPNEPNIAEVNLERFSAFLYTKALRVIPVLARKWWNGIDSKVAHLVDKITTIYVSPALCAEELTALISKKDKDGNMNIRVLMNSREVIATYGIENAKMELQLKLANNHPLGVIKVESKKHLGGKLQGWEIVKQLSIYLSHQNGRLSDGINLWKRNLDKKYDGVEECFICYSVVQMENLQLPKLSCKACKKKFHSSCLYRWFSSSNKSTCPLCRSDF